MLLQTCYVMFSPMAFSILRILLLCICLMCSTDTVYAQTNTKGTEFWFGFMENLNLAYNGPPRFSVLVSADNSTDIHITMPRTGIEIHDRIEAASMKEILLPEAIFYASGSDVTSDFGFMLTSGKPVSVKIMHYRPYFSEASIVYPITMNGTNYHTLSIRDNSRFNHPNAFVIIATQDNTHVVITPAATTGGVRPAGKPYEIILQKGQTYQVQAMGNLSGSIIKSLDNKRIAVYCGARQAYVSDKDCNPGSAADSHLFESILPDQYAGKTIIFMPLALRDGDPISILPIGSNSKIYFNGSLIKTLQYGSFDTSLNTPVVITCNNPMHIAQYSKSMGCGLTSGSVTGDPSMFYIHSSDYFSTDEMLYRPKGFETAFVSILTKTANLGNIEMDNNNIGSQFATINANTNYSYAIIPVTEGSHHIKSDSGFYAYTYGFGAYNAYTYGLGFKTEVEEEGLKLSYTIYPNPATDSVNVRFCVPKNQSVHVYYDLYDAIGKRIYASDKYLTHVDNTFRVEVAHLAQACYFLRLRYDNQSYTDKIIKVAP